MTVPERVSRVRSRLVWFGLLVFLLVPLAIAADPYLDIVVEGNRSLSTTIQGRQGVNPWAGANAGRAELNTRAAYDLAQQYLRDGTLDMARVAQINALLRQGISSNLETGGGGLRPSRGQVMDYLAPTADDFGGVRIAYPEPKALPAEAAKLDVYLKAVSSRPLTRAQAIRAAADVHSFIVSNHLFGDGNGRTARMAADWILMRNGLPPADYSAMPPGEYIPDRRLPPDQNRAKFREYMNRAVWAAESRVAALPPEARASIPGSKAGPVAEPDGIPRGPTTERGRGGAPPGEEPIELLGQRSAATYNKPWVGATTMAGGYYAGAVAHQWATGGKVDLWQPVSDLGTVQGAAGLVGSMSGYIVGEYVAATALSSLIPIPGLGRVLGRPLAQAMVRSTVGAAAGYAVGGAARGQGIDWKDLAGSSVSSGVGMAVGSLVFPPVGTIVGGIVGQVAWDLASSWSRRKEEKDLPTLDGP
jgi:hypothetical protein